MLEDTIKGFFDQLNYQPEIENASYLQRHDKFLVVGMGGSNLASGLLKVWKPELDIIIHKDFGLPSISEDELRQRLIIISSYSGNTEETVGAFEDAYKEYSTVVITKGGQLLELAQKNNIPHIQLPDVGTYPRLAIGLSLRAMLKTMGEERTLEEMAHFAPSLKVTNEEKIGKELAQKLKDKIPVIYSSGKNYPIAYYWKVDFNETSKVPSFCASFPELNHDEMIGFISVGSAPEKIGFIFLKDSEDDPRVLKRMKATQELLEEKGFEVEVVELTGNSIWQRIFGSLSLSNWASYGLAIERGVDPEDIAVLEEFKNRVK